MSMSEQPSRPRHSALKLVGAALALVLVVSGAYFFFGGGAAPEVANAQSAVARETAAALARNAEGIADSSGPGTANNANGSVPAAARETGVTVTPVGSRWTVVVGSHVSATDVCLSIPRGVNAPFTITPGRC